MKKLLSAGLFVAALPLAALALQDEPASKPVTYTIDPVHSSITFHVKHMGAAFAAGRFDSLTGELVFDEGDAGGCSVDAHVDPASVSTANADRDKHLRSGDFFAVEEHPDMRFVSTSVESKGDGTYAMKGTLSYRGVEKEIACTFEKVGEATSRDRRRVLGFTTEFVVKRSDFGDVYGVAQRILGDDVHVRVDIEAGEKR
ncbi:MAG: YceI family protein [Planctomycetota bacterium]